jgi:hypothetical protein
MEADLSAVEEVAEYTHKMQDISNIIITIGLREI